MNSYAILDEYLDNREECLSAASSQETLEKIDDALIELNKIDNAGYTDPEKNKLATPYIKTLFQLLHQKPFLVCVKFIDETKIRSNTSLVARVLVHTLKENLKRYGDVDVAYTVAELHRVYYCVANRNDVYVHDLYVYAANKGHKMASVRLQQEQEIALAHKCVVTPFDKGIVYSNNMARGIGMYRTLFEQGRLDVVPELLRACIEVKAYKMIKEVLFFLDNDSYTDQFMAQVNTSSKEEYLELLRKLYRKAKFHVILDKISKVIKNILYVLLIAGAGWVFMKVKTEAWYFVISSLFLYFSVGTFIVSRPLYSLFVLPLTLLGGAISGIADAEWDTLGEALIISSLL